MRPPSFPRKGGDRWSIYWQVRDVAAGLERVRSLGGTVLSEADETPFGVLATVQDPAGAEFKLRAPRR